MENCSKDLYVHLHIGFNNKRPYQVWVWGCVGVIKNEVRTCVMVTVNGRLSGIDFYTLKVESSNLMT